MGDTLGDLFETVSEDLVDPLQDFLRDVDGDTVAEEASERAAARQEELREVAEERAEEAAEERAEEEEEEREAARDEGLLNDVGVRESFFAWAAFFDTNINYYLPSRMATDPVVPGPYTEGGIEKADSQVPYYYGAGAVESGQPLQVATLPADSIPHCVLIPSLIAC